MSDVIFVTIEDKILKLLKYAEQRIGVLGDFRLVESKVHEIMEYVAWYKVVMILHGLLEDPDGWFPSELDFKHMSDYYDLVMAARKENKEEK